MSSSDEAPVHVAWSRVMADVHAVSKDSRNTQQNFNFRGIDAVMNAVGPAMRTHGVFVMPEVLRHETRELTSSRGTAMTGHTVTVQFTVHGPAGDTLSGIEIGESFDSGDKGSTKARSVALRTFLLQSLCIPTDEPDPDSTVYERGGWWGGWETQEQHDLAWDELKGRCKALPDVWRTELRPALQSGQAINEHGEWATRIGVDAYERLIAELAEIETKAGTEPFDIEEEEK